MSDVAITGFAAVREPRLDALPEAVRARASRTERVTQLAFSAAGPALEMAGLATTTGDPRPRIGIVLGTAFGCFLTNAAYQRRLAETGGASPRLFAATVSNAAAGELAIAYRLGGPAITLTAGSVAGLGALAHALDVIRAGQADALLAGGMDADDVALERWVTQGGLAAAMPVGEGAALLVLEDADHARSRGARVHGFVRDGELSFRPEPGAPELRAPQGFAAAGPREILARLEDLAPGAAATISAWCPSGHGATVVVERSS
jgi:3-oxoacyl-[acyl-carrier-protein] synthase II